jgi:hypothetical protein
MESNYFDWNFSISPLIRSEKILSFFYYFKIKPEKIDRIGKDGAERKPNLNKLATIEEEKAR